MRHGLLAVLLLATGAAGCLAETAGPVGEDEEPSPFTLDAVTATFPAGGGGLLVQFEANGSTAQDIRFTTAPAAGGSVLRLAIDYTDGNGSGLAEAVPADTTGPFAVAGGVDGGRHAILLLATAEGPATAEVTDEATGRPLPRRWWPVAATWQTDHTLATPTDASPVNTLTGAGVHPAAGIEVFTLVTRAQAGVGAWCPDVRYTSSGGDLTQRQCAQPGWTIAGLAPLLRAETPQAPSYFAAFPESVRLCEPAGQASYEVTYRNAGVAFDPYYLSAVVPPAAQAATGVQCP